MRKAKCEKCEGEFPMNDTLKVRENVVCRECAQSILSKEKIRANQLQQQIDPTICTGCGLDNGDTELPRLGQVPVCPDCRKSYKNRPFPMWIKAALIGIVIFVASTLIWNSRFIHAYYDLRRFGAATDAGDFELAAGYMISASEHVPENEYLLTYASWYKGMILLVHDKYAEALERFVFCRGRVGINEESDLEDLIMNARIGVAFDNCNYDEFLQLSLQMNERYKDDLTYTMKLASAYACKYAETQDEQHKTKSMTTLESAKTLASSQPEEKEYFAEYEMRILYRLHTREIINKDEFYKRYPDGWTIEGEETP